MNLVDQKRLEDFKASGKIEKIVETCDNVETTTAVMAGLCNKLSGIVHTLSNDRHMLEMALNDSDIVGIEDYTAQIEAKLGAMDTKAFKGAIDALAKAFGIEVVTSVKISKEDAQKSLGLKTK